MLKTIETGARTGAVTVPSSKSQAHRYLICAALSKEESVIACRGIPEDIEATIDCLNALGAKIEVKEGGQIHVTPIRELPPGQADLYCRESGSTLRFLLPVVGVLGVRAAFHMEGKLPGRTPQTFLYELIAHGMNIVQNGSVMECSGQLLSGMYQVPGNISSQFVSGLLLASPLLDSDNIIRIHGGVQSRDYITMTEDALTFSGIGFGRGRSAYLVYGGQNYYFPAEAAVEGDWSAAAFFLCMGALSDAGITVKGLSPDTSQGDRKILDLLKEFGAAVEETEDGVTVKKGVLTGITVDASQIPDLIPAVAALAAFADGTTVITNAQRLRLKETDRIKNICRLLTALGGEAEETEDGLIVHGKKTLAGGNAGTCKDHRIAMAAAVAACGCETPVTVEDPECVGKSYPAFWEDLAGLEKA